MLSLKTSYKATIVSSCMGYFVQALLLTYMPLLFVTFQNGYGISLSQLSFIISANFIVELSMDLSGSFLVKKIGTRNSVLLADAISAIGLCAIAFLPEILENKFVALCLASVICGIGGGLIEVLISPIVEACPTKKKSAIMSLLHSFYCWGQLSVCVLSTVFFLTVGISRWQILSCIWALVPLCNLILFCFVPINELPEETGGTKISSLCKSKIFLLFLLMMLCAGASEVSMSQWVSTFAEEGLGVQKWLGDLLGPSLFALCMGSARVFYAKKASKINLENGILVSACICVVAYLIAIFAPNPIVSLLGCALCGIGSGMLWPGTYSMATRTLEKGGVTMFGLLALFGDFGCLFGPFIVGQTSSAFSGNLKMGFLFAMVFPIALVLCVLFFQKMKKK